MSISQEQFDEWMEEKIPALYQGRRVMLHRYDTVDSPEEDIAKAAWKASREALIAELRKLEWAPCVLQEALDAAGLEDGN
jgi:hypothetical protein